MLMMDLTGYKSIQIWAGLTIACLALLFLFVVDPSSAAWYPQCPFHLITGLDCPGCGSSRGLHSLLHGELTLAADYNLLLLPAIPVLALGFYVRITRKGAAVWDRLNKPGVILWIIGLFWILRNIPGHHPLSWLNSGQ